MFEIYLFNFFMNLVVHPKPLDKPRPIKQPTRWPVECQVLNEEVRHIYYNPPVPEPYYKPTRKELRPEPIGEQLGIVVYQYYPTSTTSIFAESSIGGNRNLSSTCPSPEEDSLRFESRFESGNLAKAIKINPIYYELYLRSDLYTDQHMQWFYFRVTNMKNNVRYRFSIVNMAQDKSLFKEGMKPLLYSVKDAQLQNIGWRRCGDNITYFCNENVGLNDLNGLMTYTLTFTLEFPYEEDMVYLAYSYPYTYSDLQEYLLKLSEHQVKSKYTSVDVLCKTLSGNNLYCVTITNPQTDNKGKRGVIITARVHPGETPSSWMMQGFMNFLTSNSRRAKVLREKFIFTLVPMLNPDGVIVGNYRSSLAGSDLNTEYNTALRAVHPSIWYTKMLIKSMLEKYDVTMYCDLHAHSVMHNIFLYACDDRKNLRLGEKEFPVMLHKYAPDKFSCDFNIEKSRFEGSGRVFMWRAGIPNSYTMEASFAGSLLGARAKTHFTVNDYEEMGHSFCRALSYFYDRNTSKSCQTIDTSKSCQTIDTSKSCQTIDTSKSCQTIINYLDHKLRKAHGSTASISDEHDSLDYDGEKSRKSHRSAVCISDFLDYIDEKSRMNPRSTRSAPNKHVSNHNLLIGNDSDEDFLELIDKKIAERKATEEYVVEKSELPKTEVAEKILILNDTQETETILEVEPKKPHLVPLLLMAALCISIGMCLALIHIVTKLLVPSYLF